jgi:hypothetical protein
LGTTIQHEALQEKNHQENTMNDSSNIHLEIYTIGHSNHTLETFLNLLRGSEIEVVVDIRSNPSSQVVPHFNRKSLENSLKMNGFKYLFLGKELGGKPDNKEFYDANGHVLYGLIAKSPSFIQGIERLLKGIHDYRIVLLCGEENPSHCHRRLLVGKYLIEQGINVEHIRGDGRVQSEEELTNEEKIQYKNENQLALFDNKETDEWKSTQSVLKMPHMVPFASPVGNSEK